MHNSYKQLMKIAYNITPYCQVSFNEIALKHTAQQCKTILLNQDNKKHTLIISYTSFKQVNISYIDHNSIELSTTLQLQRYNRLSSQELQHLLTYKQRLIQHLTKKL